MGSLAQTRSGVKSVQHVYVTRTSTSLETLTATISAVDVSKTVVNCNYASRGTTSDVFAWCLSNSTTVEFKGQINSSLTDLPEIKFEVIEYV